MGCWQIYFYNFFFLLNESCQIPIMLSVSMLACDLWYILELVYLCNCYDIKVVFVVTFYIMYEVTVAKRSSSIYLNLKAPPLTSLFYHHFDVDNNSDKFWEPKVGEQSCNFGEWTDSLGGPFNSSLLLMDQSTNLDLYSLRWTTRLPDARCTLVLMDHYAKLVPPWIWRF